MQVGKIHKVIDVNEKSIDEYDQFLEEVSHQGEKLLVENESLKATVLAMRQIRGADSINFSFTERNKES